MAQQDRIAGYIFQGASVGTKIGEAIFNIGITNQSEDAKGLKSDYVKDIHSAWSSAIANGEVKFEEGPDGKVRFSGTPDSVEKISKQYQDKLQQKGYWDAINKNVNSFYTDAGNQAASSATDQLLLQYTQGRQLKFNDNYQSAINDSITMGNLKPLIEQVRSADWINDEQKQVLINKGTESVNLGIKKNALTEITTTEGYDSAMKRFDEISGSIDDQGKVALRQAIAQADKDAYNKSLSNAQSIYDQQTSPKKDDLGNIIQEGQAPADAIRAIDVGWSGRAQDKEQIISGLRKQQSTTEWELSYSIYDRDRDNLQALKDDYNSIKNGEISPRFNGIEESQKQILDMFDRQIKYKEAEIKSLSPNEDKPDFDRLAWETFKQWQESVPGADGEVSSQQATRMRLIQLGTIGANTNQIDKYLGIIDSGGKPEYSAEFSRIETYYRSALEKEKDPVRSGSIAERRDNNLEMLRAMVGKRDINTADLAKAVDHAIALEVGSDYDSIRRIFNEGAKDRVFTNDIAQFVNAAQNGKLDDVVYIDKNGNTRYTTGKSAFDQIRSRTEQMLKDAGLPVEPGSSRFVKQGQSDLSGSWTMIGSDGKTYSIRSFDNGSTAVPAVLDKDGNWKAIGPKATPAPEDPRVKDLLDKYGYDEKGNKLPETKKPKPSTGNAGWDNLLKGYGF